VELSNPVAVERVAVANEETHLEVGNILASTLVAL
jgi:hypothetical protein